jgi:bacillithiol biosynthesis cysteine-adding enzyme BshC
MGHLQVMGSAYNQAFLANQLRSDSFLPYGFGAPADRLNRVQSAARRAVSPSVLRLLVAQNAELPASPARVQNLDALSQAGTVVVITGQQVGLLLGPLYTVYKAATAVVVARQLQAETGRRCVPLFWLQTEDHDFAEIASALSWSPSGLVSLTLPDEGVERTSVAQRTVPTQVASLFEPLASSLEGLPHAGEVLTLLREAYRPGRPLAQAFAHLLTSLFRDEGLVVFDPRCAPVAQLAAPLVHRSITQRRRLAQVLEARAAELTAAGHAVQVHLRSSAPLSFFHLVDARGPRYRLDEGPAGFVVPGSAPAVISEAGLLKVLEADPMRFSTSALLRPVLQDTLFPTAAYVGGPAEIGYFAQMLPLYAEFGVEPSLVVPRARFRLILPSTRRVLEALGLTGPDAEQPLDQVLGRLASRVAPTDGAPSLTWLTEVEAKLSTFAQQAGDVGLVKAAQRTRATLVRGMGRLERRYQRQRAAHDATLHARVRRLADALFPQAAPQERQLCFAAFAAQVGPRQLVQSVLSLTEPLHPALKEVPL